MSYRPFHVVVPVLDKHEVTERFLGSWVERAAGALRFLLIDNGSRDPLEDQPFLEGWRAAGHTVVVLRIPSNYGVYPTFQLGLEATCAPWIFFTHNDVEMREEGWDEKLGHLLGALEEEAEPGVCGMFGAEGLGTPEIYRAPYDFRQMVRWQCYTVPSMTPAGGAPFSTPWRRVAVLDGFSLIVRRAMVERALDGRFDFERFPVHHMYDHDICLASHYGGFENYVLGLDCWHPGGQTSKDPSWAECLGTSNHRVHRRAHEVFYEKWRGRLPAAVAARVTP